MDIICIGDKELEASDISAIMTPPRIYFRLPKLNMMEAMAVVADENSMAEIKYGDRVYKKCKLIAVSNENGIPRISASYENIEKGE